MKIIFLDVDFLEDEFPSIAELKEGLEIYRSQQETNPSPSEVKDLNSHKVTWNGMHPLFDMNSGCLFAQENEVCS